MRSLVPRLAGTVATLSLVLAACSTDAAEPRADAAAADGSILTSFDRLTVAPGERSSFRASLVGAGARLSSAGLVFTSRQTAVARVTATKGRTEVQGVASGRTWVVVRGAAATDSVEVVVP